MPRLQGDDLADLCNATHALPNLYDQWQISQAFDQLVTDQLTPCH